MVVAVVALLVMVGAVALIATLTGLLFGNAVPLAVAWGWLGWRLGGGRHDTSRGDPRDA